MTTEISTIALMKSNNLSDVNALSGRFNLGLGNVEDKSASMILSGMTANNISSALGYAPLSGISSNNVTTALGYTPTAIINSSLTLYVATNGNDNYTFTQAQNPATPLATPHKALELLKPYYINPDAVVTISVGSGTFNFTTQIVFSHPCGQQIQIIGTSSAASSDVITSANTTTFNYTNQTCTGIYIYKSNCLAINKIYFKGGSSGAKNNYSGIVVAYNSYICTLGPLIKVEYFLDGIATDHASSIGVGSYITSQYNSSNGILIQNGGWALIQNVKARYNNQGIAVIFGKANIDYANCSNNTDTGIYITGNSTVNAIYTSQSSNKYGIKVTGRGYVNCMYSIITNNTIYGMQALDMSYILSYSATLSGNATNASPAVNTVGNGNSYISN